MSYILSGVNRRLVLLVRMPGGSLLGDCAIIHGPDLLLLLVLLLLLLQETDFDRRSGRVLALSSIGRLLAVVEEEWWGDPPAHHGRMYAGSFSLSWELRNTATHVEWRVTRSTRTRSFFVPLGTA